MRLDKEVSLSLTDIQSVDDANKVRGAIPHGSKAEKAGEKTGLEGGIEEAVSLPSLASFFPLRCD